MKPLLGVYNQVESSWTSSPVDSNPTFVRRWRKTPPRCVCVNGRNQGAGGRAASRRRLPFFVVFVSNVIDILLNSRLCFALFFSVSLALLSLESSPFASSINGSSVKPPAVSNDFLRHKEWSSVQVSKWWARSSTMMMMEPKHCKLYRQSVRHFSNDFCSSSSSCKSILDELVATESRESCSQMLPRTSYKCLEQMMKNPSSFGKSRKITICLTCSRSKVVQISPRLIFVSGHLVRS